MTARFFVDTNILVYVYDRRDPDRRDSAIALLRALAHTQAVAVSTQILGEFFWTVTRRIPDPLSPAEAAAVVSRHARTWQVLDLTWATVQEALRGATDHQLSYWDALIWATARLAGIPVVMSEDFQDDREIEGVRFQNPFPQAAAR